MRTRRGSGPATAAAARRAASVRRHPPRPTPPTRRWTAPRGGRVPSRGGRRGRARAASATGPRGRDRRQRHRLDLDVGARLIGVDLQEHVADAQRRALAMGDDDLDLVHVGHYRGARSLAEREGVGGDGGESNSPSRTLRRRPLRACPMVCRRPPERASAPCRTVQSRAPRSGLTPDYVTLVRIAAPLNDASTTREAEVASTLTLLPKQRGRESTGGCQVLRFAA